MKTGMLPFISVWSHRDEDDDLEEVETVNNIKETLKRVTFALPNDEDTEDTNVLNVQKRL